MKKITKDSRKEKMTKDSGYWGVQWNEKHKAWVAYFFDGITKTTVGYYPCKHRAAIARANALIEHESVTKKYAESAREKELESKRLRIS